MMQVQNEDCFLKEGLLDREGIANVERVKLALPFPYFASKRGKKECFWGTGNGCPSTGLPEQDALWLEQWSWEFNKTLNSSRTFHS